MSTADEGDDHGRWRGQTDADLDTVQRRLDHHDTRLTNVEKFVLMAKGALLILSLIVGSGVVAIVTQKFLL